MTESADTNVSLIGFKPTPHYTPVPDTTPPFTALTPPISHHFFAACNTVPETVEPYKLTPVAIRCRRYAFVHVAYWLPTTITVTSVETIVMARGIAESPERTITRNYTEDLIAMAAKLMPEVQKTSMGVYRARKTVDLVFGTESTVMLPRQGNWGQTYPFTMYVLSPRALLHLSFFVSLQLRMLEPCVVWIARTDPYTGPHLRHTYIQQILTGYRR
jgi:hypothetical protein